MKISLSKCNFGFAELKALGHVVSGLQLGIDKNRVAAVLLKPMPRTLKETQSFLGFASYYRNHIPNFAKVSKPLYELCSKDVVFELTKERVEAYKKIKDLLTNGEILCNQILKNLSNYM